MNLASFLIYCMIVTFTPGPTNMVILSVTHNCGIKKAMEYVWGATIAFGMLLTVSAVLNSVMTAVVPKILSFMGIIGSLYMLYLAYQIYNMDASEAAAEQTATFSSGCLMQFVNPKILLFTMTVIPSFVLPYYTSVPAVAIFVTVITIIGFLAFITWVFLGRVLKGFLQKYQKAAQIIMALFLVYSAVMISEIVEFFRR